MNEGKYKFLKLLCISAVLLLAGQVSLAISPRDTVSSGNQLYRQGEFEKAVELYDKAIAADDKLAEPVYNKAAALYRLGDFADAAKLYNEAAIKSVSSENVLNSRYNLGNCYFQQANQAVQKEPQLAVKNLKQAIGYWRKVLDADATNEKAAVNVQIAKALVQQLKEQMKNSQRDPNSQQDPNSQRDPNQPQDPNSQQQNQPQDPNEQQQNNKNQPGDSNDVNDQQQQNNQQNSEPNQPDEPNQNQQQNQQLQKQQPKPQPQQDMDAQQILEKEQQRKKQRLMLLKSKNQKVEKDW